MTGLWKKPWVWALLAIALVGAGAAFWFGRRVAVIALSGSGLDPAIPVEYRVAPSVHPELAAHTKRYAKQWVTVGKRVHVAIGYGLANLVFIEGDTGMIVVDTGENLDQAEAVLAELRTRTEKPVVAVILTHHHADHVLGTAAFVSAEDVKSGKVPVIAHASLIKHYVDETGILAELQAARAMHMYGGPLGPADRENSNAGIGPFLSRAESGFIAPTKTFAETLDETIDGVRMSMRWLPSEAESEIAIYLRDENVLLSADIIQGHTFPNLYTIRGARYRDPMRWVQGVDVLRAWEAESLVLHHGPPVLGRKEVKRVLTVYRDEMQYTHDQTIRRMNQGMTPQEIAEAVLLPPTIEKEHPWSQQFYGTLSHSTRNIYNGYVGWFQGDPVDLNPTPRPEQARRYITLMGGRDRVLTAAKNALAKNKAQEAAELATLLLRVNVSDDEPRRIKASAFRELGYAQMNASWRNYYLVSAMELDGQIPTAIYLREVAKVLGPAFRTLPPESQLATLPTRLRAEATFDKNLIVAVRYTDLDRTFRLHLRHGVLEVSPLRPSGAVMLLEVTQQAMGDLLAGVDPKELLGTAITVQGDPNVAAEFLGYFERPFQAKPEVVVR